MLRAKMVRPAHIAWVNVKVNGLKMAKRDPIKFFKEVKSETKKVTWPTRQETIASMIAVSVMVVFSAVFLFISDQVIAYLVNLILSIGS